MCKSVQAMVQLRNSQLQSANLASKRYQKSAQKSKICEKPSIGMIIGTLMTRHMNFSQIEQVPKKL